MLTEQWPIFQCGVAEVFDPAKDGSVTARAELLEMRYEGPAEA